MGIDELKVTVDAYRKDLEGKSGKTCLFSEKGPVGMGLIDAIVSVLEAQQNRITDLERKLGGS